MWHFWRTLVPSVLLSANIFAGVPAAQAQVQFANPKTYPVGNSPTEVVAADINGDGKLDLIVLNTGDQTISVLFGNGDGTFQAAKSIAAGATAAFLAVGDLNGDGKPDLAVANGSSNTVSVMLGNGDGTFQAAVPYNTNASADYVAVADFNGDKKPDLLVASKGHSPSSSSNPVPGAIAIFLGNGDGSFQAAEVTQTNPAADTAAFVAVGDFNGDGKPDVVTGYESAPNSCLPGATDCFVGHTVVYLGNGDGTFQSPIDSAFPGQPGPFFLVAAELDGDKKLDLAVVGQETGEEAVLRRGVNHDVVASLIGDGAGGFTFSTDLDLPMCDCLIPLAVASNIVAVDLNGDGKLDLLFPVAYTNAVSYIGAANSPGSPGFWVLLGNGDGTFQSTPQQFNTASPGWVAAADFNGDSLADVVIVSPSANTVSVALNITPTFSLSANSTSLTVSSGNPQTDELQIAGVNGFAITVNLACTVAGPSPMPTCELSSAAVTPGANPATTMLTVTAPTSAALLAKPLAKAVGITQIAAVGWLPLAMALVVFTERRKQWRSRLLLGAVVVLLFMFPSACGGGSSGGNGGGTDGGAGGGGAAQSYTVTVTATSGSIQQTVQVAVTIP